MIFFSKIENCLFFTWFFFYVWMIFILFYFLYFFFNKISVSVCWRFSFFDSLYLFLVFLFIYLFDTFIFILTMSHGIRPNLTPWNKKGQYVCLIATNTGFIMGILPQKHGRYCWIRHAVVVFSILFYKYIYIYIYFFQFFLLILVWMDERK